MRVPDGRMEEAPVFYPTLEDMAQPFEKYIERIEDQFADIGICKIVAPDGWTPRAKGYDNLDHVMVPKPIQQNVTGYRGVFHAVHIEKKSMHFSEFKEQAALPLNRPTPRCTAGDHENLEREFWKNVTHSRPLYGADGVGTLFDRDLKDWNVGRLDTLLSRTLKNAGISIPGVNTPYLYFGMWRSLFAWHTEDVDLYSVNYLHFGAQKSWYSIRPAHRERFETLLQGLAPHMHKECNQFLRHKETLVTPQLLQSHNIPVTRIVQGPGEFIINFPGVYHAGFNHGLNCAESTNFATKRWIEIGAKAKPCTCGEDVVKIDMRLFGADVPQKAFRGRQAEDAPLQPSTPVLIAAVPKKRRMQRTTARGSMGGQMEQKAEALQVDQWVQCEDCDKWRILPPEANALLLEPEAEFHCSLLHGITCDTLEDPYDESKYVWNSLEESTDTGDNSSQEFKLMTSMPAKRAERERTTPESTEGGDANWVATVLNSPGSLKLRVRLKKLPDEGSNGTSKEESEPRPKRPRRGVCTGKPGCPPLADSSREPVIECDFRIPQEWEAEQSESLEEAGEGRGGDYCEQEDSQHMVCEPVQVNLEVWDGRSEEIGFLGGRDCRLKRNRALPDRWDPSGHYRSVGCRDDMRLRPVVDVGRSTAADSILSGRVEWYSVPVKVNSTRVKHKHVKLLVDCAGRRSQLCDA